MDKKELLKQVWKECSLQEILEAGYETESIEAIDVIKEAEQIDKESFTVSLKTDFIENLAELFEITPSRELPYAHDVMDEISNHYSDFQLIDYFDKDDLIEHCEGSYEMDNYINNKRGEIIDEYFEENPSLTKNDIIRNLQEGMKYQLRDFLCDLVDAGHWISDEVLLNEIRQRI